MNTEKQKLEELDTTPLTTPCDNIPKPPLTRLNSHLECRDGAWIEVDDIG